MVKKVEKKSKKEAKKHPATSTAESAAGAQQVLDPLSVLNPIASEGAKEGMSTVLKLVISALTLVSALAWNDLIKTLFKTIKAQFPEGEGEIAELAGLLIYALLVTLVTVFTINRLKKLRKKVDPDAVDKKK
ncbi:MAG: DUF5654 family protein [Candidatus Dojkabacteria bacterium]